MASAHGRDSDSLLHEALDLWAEQQARAAAPSHRWSELPEILAASLFNSLFGKDASAARLVCSRWAEYGLSRRKSLILSSKKIADNWLSPDNNNKLIGDYSLPLPEICTLSLSNDLEDAETSARVIDGIAQMPMLTSLTLGRAIHADDLNRLNAALPRLRSLHLHQVDEGAGRSAGAIAEALKLAKQLESLEIDTVNHFQDEENYYNSDDIAPLIPSSATCLTICDMDFSSSGLDQLQHLTRLENLCLKRPAFRNTPMLLNGVSNVTSLEILQPVWLEDGVGAGFSESLPLLERLRHLCLEEDQFFVAEEREELFSVVSSLPTLTSLTSLDLKMQTITDGVVRVVGKMTKLRSLDLTSHRSLRNLSGQFLTELSGLRCLEQLTINGGRFDLASMPWPEQLSTVTSLSLINIQAPVESVCNFAEMPQLRDLKMIRCLPEDSNKASLQKRLSNMTSSLTSLSIINNPCVTLDTLRWIRLPQLREFEHRHQPPELHPTVTQELLDLLGALEEFKRALPVLSKSSPWKPFEEGIIDIEQHYGQQTLGRFVHSVLRACHEVLECSASV